MIPAILLIGTYLMVTIFLILGMSFYRTFFLYKIWEWFAPTLGLPSYSIWQIFALNILIGLFFYYPTKKEKDQVNLEVIMALFYYPVCLLGAWIIKTYLL